MNLPKNIVYFFLLAERRMELICIVYMGTDAIEMLATKPELFSYRGETYFTPGLEIGHWQPAVLCQYDTELGLKRDIVFFLMHLLIYNSK